MFFNYLISQEFTWCMAIVENSIDLAATRKHVCSHYLIEADLIPADVIAETSA